MCTASELSRLAFEASLIDADNADDLAEQASAAYREEIGSTRGRFDHVLDGPRKR